MTSLVVCGSSSLQLSNNCGVCKGNKARVLVCGHRHHLKCLKGGVCVDCGTPAKTTTKVKSETFASATQRMTTGVNGNAYITINQQDEWGRTTIIREIKKDKIHSYVKTVKNNKDNKVEGEVNLGLMFMSSLIGAKRIQ
jgi:hypothetical protein